MPPVSSSSSSRMTHTPVSSSPASSARSTGAAPRHRGSNEKCRLTNGSTSSTWGLMICPKATTTPSSTAPPSATSITSSTACDTVRPSSIAAALTGLGVSSPPRPRRLSARVTTSATSCPAATRSRSGRTAISGVPRYTSFTARSAQPESAAHRLARCLLRRLLLEEAVFAQGLLALIGRHAVEHEHALEMVDLVLEHARLEFVGLDVDHVAVEVDAAHVDHLGPQHLDVQARNRQATFVVDPFTVGLDDLRVDDRQRFVTEVPHDDLLLHPDLRRGERQAVARVGQRVEHVVDEPDDLAVDVVDVTRLRFQDGVSEG